ncbi:MAG: type I-D CRISPR-associated protein Cas7/Csc2, partial [Endomicrobia bacterium]|nr:type I-D CRISPR-associated protein Cas7/Csc2 [Endomicrobiia bacterium]
MSKDFLNVLRENNAFAEMITDVKKNKYIQVVIARELQSYGIFTTEGRILNVAETTAGVKDNSKVTRVLMIKRKQVASER